MDIPHTTCRHYDGCTAPAAVIVHYVQPIDPDYDHNAIPEHVDTALCLTHAIEYRAGLVDPDAIAMMDD